MLFYEANLNVCMCASFAHTKTQHIIFNKGVAHIRTQDLSLWCYLKSVGDAFGAIWDPAWTRWALALPVSMLDALGCTTWPYAGASATGLVPPCQGCRFGDGIVPNHVKVPLPCCIVLKPSQRNPVSTVDPEGPRAHTSKTSNSCYRLISR